MTGRLLAAAAAGFAVFFALGWWVTHHPLSRLDLAGARVLGSATPLAVALTRSGYGFALTVVIIVALVGSRMLGFPWLLGAGITASQILSQIAVSACKGIFGRARPSEWLFVHELGASYPSGHATTAVVFYGAWALALWNSGLWAPARVAGCGALILWALGICWSRVALGAHYPTDVLGGMLFGSGWLCVVIAIARARHLMPLARHT